MSEEQRTQRVEAHDVDALRRIVTEQRAEIARLQRELHHGERLATVGKLALGLAHDFNNALACVISFNELTLDAPADQVAELRAEVDRSARGAAALAHRMLALGKKREPMRIVLDVDAQLGDLAKMLERLLASTPIRFEADLCSGGHARIDAIELSQVVMNLATNARDAMPDGGTLTISSRLVDLPPARAASLRVPPGAFVEITVRDSGAGISSANLARIFDPFYTTKPADQGTGLGLAVVQRIVNAARGAIAVTTDRGRGTSVQVLLPACPALDGGA